MAKKRIIALSELQTLADSDYVMTDGTENGSKKFKLKKVTDDITDIKADFNNLAIVNSASGTIASFNDGLPYNAKSLSIELPYSANGYTGATVTRTGKNLLPKGVDKANVDIVFTVNNDGSVTVTGTAESTKFWGVQFTLPPGTYTYSGCPSGGSGSTYYVDIRNAVGGSGMPGAGSDQGSGYTFTITEPITAYLNIRIANGYAIPTGGITFYPQIEVGSLKTTYEPYTTPTTLPITWTSAGTVYGGTVDIANGELISKYASDGTELSPYDIYQITAQDLSLLNGYNNAWADVGNTTVGYLADTKKYIDNAIAALS